MTVGEIPKRSVVTAHPDDTIIEAARRMRDRHVGALVVADTVGRPLGMLTDRDLVVGALAGNPRDIETLKVGDVMSRHIVTAHRDEPVELALKEMRTHGIRRLPVISADGRLEGVVTLDDILEEMSGELRDLVSLVAREQSHEREVRR